MLPVAPPNYISADNVHMQVQIRLDYGMWLAYAVQERKPLFAISLPPPAIYSLRFRALRARWIRRYGHTKIVRDMGAPPTAAQLGGPPGPPGGGASYPPPMRGPPPMAMAGPPPMVGPPPMAGQSSDGYAPAQARSQYASPQAGYYGQPYGGSGAMQTSFGQQPFAQPPPPAANQQSAMPAYPRPPSNMNGGVGEGRGSLPSPGGYAYTPPGMGSAALPSTASPENESRGGGAGGGYHVFNPSTDRVVAADSTSNAVL